MSEREPYTPPAEPIVIGAIEVSKSSYYGSGLDFSVYSSSVG